ncbi:suppressor of cytokine signaling 7-like [Amphibalanus amphitrite]|uniref:suppressor of cytokine signaling 7-like n=1 Tax=Amphibalanus amphitrite TaxID=1232801 RepID=UPI001C90D1F6|nr:suppressor of cytokine signaling 7-like [Amphibalanus amphitrite]
MAERGPSRPPQRPSTLQLTRPRPLSVHSPIADFADSLAEQLVSSAAAELRHQTPPPPPPPCRPGHGRSLSLHSAGSGTSSGGAQSARCLISKLGDADLDTEPALFSLRHSAPDEPLHMTLEEVRRSVCELPAATGAAARPETDSPPPPPPPVSPPPPPAGGVSRRPSLPLLGTGRGLRCAPLSPRRVLQSLARVRQDLRQLLTPRRDRRPAAATAATERPPAPSETPPPPLPERPPPAEAEEEHDDHDDENYLDGSGIEDLEMLGITEGWGPSPARRASAGPADFATIIEKVKDCGWYWGPISCSSAEAILKNEPDGSFIVRDSSDDRYIFSLTFKLRGLIRHARIEHNNGNFSFGGMHKFRSNTIVDFIENAVEYSRSGRYLFFLHRRPAHGPMRVQLLHPVSRFKHIQSLKHLCRFVILKQIPRDHIDQLPLPEPLKHYLSSPCYFSEQLEETT